ncbi:MAG: hypothetical protein ACXABM_06465 [Candidatus Thorarchaeota archaeon]|jgi:hypothetical protein
MSISTDVESGGIQITLLSGSKKIDEGLLFYRKDGPVVELKKGTIVEDTEELFFTISKTSGISVPLSSDTRIALRHELVVELGYSNDGVSRFEMYPPSSNKWLTYVVDSGQRAIYTIQAIHGTDRKLLTIVDRSTSVLLHSVLVQSYESAILEMKRDWDVRNEIQYGDDSDTDIYDILDKEPPSWGSLAKLIEGVSIPDLKMKKTMGETLDQLVPNSFPSSTRKQLIAFLGWIDSATIPKDDPADYVLKYGSVGVFRSLARGHIQCIFDNAKPPNYVQLLHLADTGQLNISKRPRSEAAEFDIWTQVWHKFDEIFPDWMGKVVKWASHLQKENRFVTKLPVSKDDAKISRNAWSDRFAIVQHGLFMRGNVFKESIGLVSAIYIGAAHRWPHKHLEWSARLGFGLENPQYVQILALPPSALERITRILETVRIIDWETSTMNLSLYDSENNAWNFKQNLILKSLKRKRSLIQIGNEFGRWRGKHPFRLTRQQSKVLDLISRDIYLSTLERGRYTQYYGLSVSQIKEELEYMHEKGVFRLQYFLIPRKLRSLCIIANGPSEHICSMARSFLKYTPSTQARITNGGKTGIIISRIPADEHYDFVNKLSTYSMDSELSLRILPISAYAGYRNNLYSRLLKDDGSWDDDVSGLLSQVRIRSKSDSN